MGGQVPAGSPLSGATRKSRVMGTRELPRAASCIWSLCWHGPCFSGGPCSLASAQCSFPPLGTVHLRCGPAPQFIHACAAKTALSPKQGQVQRGCTKANPNLERPLVVLGSGTGFPRASPGFGLGPRLGLPGMSWTAPARWLNSENHSAWIITSPVSKSGPVPQANDAEEA